MEQVGNEVATQPSTTQVVTYSVTNARIDELAEEFKEVPADLTVKANYELCRKATSTIRGLRGDVEKRRKQLKADALAWGKLVDGEAKTITERLLAIEEPFANAKKDFDTAVEISKREAVLAEERRVDGIADRIALIKATVNACISSPSSVIGDVMTKISIDELPCDDWAMEFSEKAHAVILETMGKLKELRDMKEVQEQTAAQQAKDEAKRKADDERRRAEEDAARKQRDEELAAERRKLAEERSEFEREKAEQEKKQESLSVIAPVQQTNESPIDESPAIGKDYLAAGDGLSRYCGTATKQILDAIVAGKIPFITFTGKLS